MIYKVNDLGIGKNTVFSKKLISEMRALNTETFDIKIRSSDKSISSTSRYSAKRNLALAD